VDPPEERRAQLQEAELPAVGHRREEEVKRPRREVVNRRLPPVVGLGFETRRREAPGVAKRLAGDDAKS
jgi:hypothetical protein